MYDSNGSPIGMQYHAASYAEDEWDTYWYEKNIFGDIVAIYDEDGTKIVSYTYTAYGVCKKYVIGIAGVAADNLNPFLYRGYYYDSDIGLYYLQTRYYAPVKCRFISPDKPAYLGANGDLTSYNLYAYCSNNPVMYVDPTGNWIETVFDLFSLGVSLVEVLVNPIDPLAWAGLAGDAFDLLPFVTGTGESIRGVRVVAKNADLADGTLEAVRFSKAVDFSADSWDLAKSLDRGNGLVKSSASIGTQIHRGYKASPNFMKFQKEYNKIPGIRPDYVDFVTSTIYELKPMNVRGIKSGVKQLIKYKSSLGKHMSIVLEFY